jgi:DNA-binding beta-propeller fold protein YncE
MGLRVDYHRVFCIMHIRRPQRTLWAVFAVLLAAVCGCDGNRASIGHLKAVWGRRGISDGRFQKPRAMAIDDKDRIYIVDMTARIQVFDTEGQFLHKWQTPDHKVGKPTGMSIGPDGNVWIADTHYYRVLVYTPEGKLLKTIGGRKGDKPGQFGLVTSIVHDSAGNCYISEYGDFDRIQKFSPEGKFIRQWGGHGSEPGQFIRPQKMAVDDRDHIWVTDSCNHRIQVFDTDGKLLKVWGKEGTGLGEMYYPYDLVLGDNNTIYVCEFGNHRVQKFTRDGQSLGTFGVEGRGEGQFSNPWAIVRDSRGTIYVLDTGNHRVQVVRM